MQFSINDFLTVNVRPELGRINDEIQKLNKDYMAVQMKYDKEKIFYPDANSFHCEFYGSIKGYMSKDAVYLPYHTTLKGIMERDNPDIL